MPRILILLAILVLVWIALEMLFRRLRAAADGRRVAAGRRDPRSPAAGPGTAADRLVPCAVCGVRVPGRRAIPAPGGGAVFCSEACRLAASAAS